MGLGIKNFLPSIVLFKPVELEICGILANMYVY